MCNRSFKLLHQFDDGGPLWSGFLYAVHVLVLMIICRSEAVLCLTTAYEAEREAHIAMTYVPAHLYYMLFELMKVSCHMFPSFCSESFRIKVTSLTVFHVNTHTYTHCYWTSVSRLPLWSFILLSLQTCVSSCNKLNLFISLTPSHVVFLEHCLCLVEPLLWHSAWPSWHCLYIPHVKTISVCFLVY